MDSGNATVTDRLPYEQVVGLEALAGVVCRAEFVACFASACKNMAATTDLRGKRASGTIPWLATMICSWTMLEYHD